MRLTVIFPLLTIASAGWKIKDETSTLSTKPTWKKVKPMIVKVVTDYGITYCCGVHRSEPLYPGEMRQHMCDLLQCRAVAKDGKKVLEKWRCEDCLALTPQCKRYKRRRDRRNLSTEEKKDLRLARHARKIRYRQMKRAQIKQDRRARREKLRQLRNSRKQQKKVLRTQKKSSKIRA